MLIPSIRMIIILFGLEYNEYNAKTAETDGATMPKAESK